MYGERTAVNGGEDRPVVAKVYATRFRDQQQTT